MDFRSDPPEDEKDDIKMPLWVWSLLELPTLFTAALIVAAIVSVVVGIETMTTLLVCRP